MEDCEWYRVYDIIQDIHKWFSKGDQTTFRFENDLHDPAVAPLFSNDLNEFWVEEGIGWQLVNGEVVFRGNEVFQEAVKAATSQLQKNKRPTASSHIQSAVKSLSERPKANTAGAVAQATSALECVMHDITGQAMTLGKYLDKYAGLFHPSLKKALDGVYGFASDAGARHGKEGREPTFDEAQFAVTTCAAACTLLTAMNPQKDKQDRAL